MPGLKTEKFSCFNFIKLISIEVETEITDSFQVMTVAEEALDKGLMTGIEEDILLLDSHPEDIKLQEVTIAGKTITNIQVTVGIPDLEVNTYLLPGSPELHLGHPVGTMTNILATDNLVIFPENVLLKTLL